MLALLDSLLTVGFDPEDQGRRFLAWRDRGAYTPDGDGLFDIGNATSEALRRLRSGVPAEDAGPSGEWDNDEEEGDEAHALASPVGSSGQRWEKAA
jgi:ADP-ribosylglycohydrolase